MRISIECEVQPPPPDEWSIGYDFDKGCLCITKNHDTFALMSKEHTERLLEEIRTRGSQGK